MKTEECIETEFSDSFQVKLAVKTMVFCVELVAKSIVLESLGTTPSCLCSVLSRSEET